ncbi:MAG: hypothetical protein Q4E45_09870, partial [Eubacteriales bacterium]|nr:hypothetical protein [Eubacteriales bacterium]
MDNKPHGREKKVGTGSASVGKGRKVDTGGRPVGGGSQNGRPSGSQTPPQRGGSEPRRGGGKAVGAVGLAALFAFIPKKYRGLVLIAVVAFLIYSFMGGGGGQSSAPVVTQAPAYTMPPQSEQVQAVDDANMLFSSSDLSELFGSYGLFGPSGSSYSGSQPSGSSSSVGSGGLLQGLPGVDLSTPKPTATPKPT